MDIAKDLAAGTAAGVLGKFVEFPFDTIKVRVQESPDFYKGYWDCFLTMARQEGVRGFYRGLAAPTIGAGFEIAVCFMSFGQGMKVYRSLSRSRPEDPVPLAAMVGAGMVAGAGVAHILTPVELLKCRMQVQNMRPPEHREFTGVFDCARKTIRKEGLSALFKGHTATLAREIPGNGAWFGFYNLSLMLMTPKGQKKEDLPTWKLAISGGFAGLSYWTAFFPADVVKTRMQVDDVFLKKGLVKGLVDLFKKGGVRALYSGWTITCIRAVPANAIIFSSYEVAASLWDRQVARWFPEEPPSTTGVPPAAS